MLKQHVSNCIFTESQPVAFHFGVFFFVWLCAFQEFLCSLALGEPSTLPLLVLFYIRRFAELLLRLIILRRLLVSIIKYLCCVVGTFVLPLITLIVYF